MNGRQKAKKTFRLFRQALPWLTAALLLFPLTGPAPAAAAPTGSPVRAQSAGTAGSVYSTSQGVYGNQAVYPEVYEPAFPPQTNSVNCNVESLTITPAPAATNAGQSLRFTATAAMPGGWSKDVTALSTWTSSDPSVATMEASTAGQADSHAQGSSTVTAVYGNMSGSVTLNVGPPVTVALSVNPAPASIAAGRTQQFAATATWSDGSATDVTGQTVWTSANTTVATIDAGTGLATGVTSGGPAVITAVYGSLTAQATLTVTAVNDGGGNGTPGNGGNTPPGTNGNVPGPNGSYNGSGSGTGPVASSVTSNLPAGTLLDRAAGAVFAGDGTRTNGIPDGAVYLPSAGATVAIPINTQPPGPDYSIQVYHWQPLPLDGSAIPGRWVALATSLQSGRAVAVNDGGYKGWFAAWWVVEPRYNDIAGTWAENAIKRLSGLGLVNGYPESGLSRTFGYNRLMTRAEFAAITARIADINAPDRTYVSAKALSGAQEQGILRKGLTDWRAIPGWAAPYVAALTKAGYVRGVDGAFDSTRPITRVQAGFLVSEILKGAGYAKPADFKNLRDASTIPAWAEYGLVDGILRGSGNLLRPNAPITRSEAAVLLVRMVRDLGY